MSKFSERHKFKARTETAQGPLQMGFLPVFTVAKCEVCGQPPDHYIHALEKHERSASSLARAEAQASAPSVASVVLGFIGNRAGHGATCEEVEIGLEMKHQTVSPAITQLKNRNLVVERGDFRVTSSGRRAAVYVTLVHFHGKIPGTGNGEC